MKVIKSLSFLIVGSLTMLSCSNDDSSTEEANASTTTNTVQEEVVSNVISLNNGEKWKVNEEMMPFILQAEQLVLNHEGTSFSDLADHLMDLNKQLISSCTMDGPAHDELHNWLHPHIELLKEFKKQENPEHSAKALEDIKDSFTLFHQYFE